MGSKGRNLGLQPLQRHGAQHDGININNIKNLNHIENR